jgi:hypothetical protein
MTRQSRTGAACWPCVSGAIDSALALELASRGVALVDGALTSHGQMTAPVLRSFTVAVCYSGSLPEKERLDRRSHTSNQN